MNNAKRDENHTPTLIAVSSDDGETIIPLEVDPSTGELLVDDGTTGTDYGTPNAKHDENHVPCIMAVSSVDGVTPVAVYVNPNGELLITSS